MFAPLPPRQSAVCEYSRFDVGFECSAVLVRNLGTLTIRQATPGNREARTVWSVLGSIRSFVEPGHAGGAGDDLQVQRKGPVA